jgi:protein ImuB
LVVCILISRFPLLAAVGGRRERLLHAAALAPEPGGSQTVGEVSGAAEAFGVRAGMALGEALSRCPELALVTPDAERTESMWEELIGRVESVGAAVETGRPGEAYFEAEGLEGIWGGHLEGVLKRVRGALDMPARIGAAPTRFVSYAAAWGARGRGVKRRAIVPPGTERAFMAPLWVAMLDGRLEADISVELERLGIRTLGELAALPSGAVADRFGAVGLRAHELAGGVDRPLRPRPPREEVSESLELPEAASGSQLAHALSLLVDRLLAHPARRGRSFRRLRITGRLAANGGWRSEVTLRQTSAESELLRLALLPRLEELPGPATRLGLQALVLGPLGHAQPALSRSPRERRRDRLGEAVRQARAAGGRDAVLRVLDVDVRSRVPERRVMLTPFPEAPE